MQRLAQDLASPRYQVYFRAILNCKEESVTSAEAKENCLDTKLQQLVARDDSLPIRVAVTKAIKSWADSQFVASYFIQFFC